jgi:hypothetical protein
LIQRKAGRWAGPYSAVMDEGTSVQREIADLEARAAWNRKWAEVAGSETERLARLRLAEYFEARARALAQPDLTPHLCP